MFESKEDLKEKIAKLESELATLKKVNTCLQTDIEKMTKSIPELQADCNYQKGRVEDSEKYTRKYYEIATRYEQENKALKETNIIYKELAEAQEKKIRALENHIISGDVVG